jgi:hypothetical protein
MKADPVRDALLALPAIADPAARAARLHELGYADCTDGMDILASLVLTDAAPVAHEALEILDLIEVVDGEELEAVAQAAQQALADPKTEAWRRPLLEELIEMFE